MNDLQSIPFSAASEVDTDSLVHKNEVLSLKMTNRTMDDRQYWQEVFFSKRNGKNVNYNKLVRSKKIKTIIKDKNTLRGLIFVNGPVTT